MAEDAVDRAIEEFSLQTRRPALAVDVSGSFAAREERVLDGRCQTLNLRLLGAHGFSDTLFIDLIRQFNLDADVAKHLAHSYGDRAWEVATLSGKSTESRQQPVTGIRLTPRYPFIDGEIRYAVRNEYAETAADFLARRTRLSFLDAEAALAALPEVVDLMAEELRWSEARKEIEWTSTVHYLASMGLDHSKMSVTREQVEMGFQQAPQLEQVPLKQMPEVSVDNVPMPIPA